MGNLELGRDVVDWYQFIYYLLSAILISKHYTRYINIFALFLLLKAGFSKLIKFPHPGYLNRVALTIAADNRVPLLKARYHNLPVQVAHALKLVSWEIALRGIAQRITAVITYAIVEVKWW